MVRSLQNDRVEAHVGPRLLRGKSHSVGVTPDTHHSSPFVESWSIGGCHDPEETHLVRALLGEERRIVAKCRPGWSWPVSSSVERPERPIDCFEVCEEAALGVQSLGSGRWGFEKTRHLIRMFHHAENRRLGLKMDTSFHKLDEKHHEDQTLRIGVHVLPEMTRTGLQVADPAGKRRFPCRMLAVGKPLVAAAAVYMQPELRVATIRVLAPSPAEECTVAGMTVHVVWLAASPSRELSDQRAAASA